MVLGLYWGSTGILETATMEFIGFLESRRVVQGSVRVHFRLGFRDIS